jgi:hypothetical protein
LAWDKLKKKFDPISDPSLFKTERAFKQRKLEKGEDPEIWITNLEEVCLKLEDIESYMTDSQFMVQVFNRHTNDYELQMVLMIIRIDKKESLLTIDKLHEKLSLGCKRL